MYWYGSDVRRKILRLYRADAVEYVRIVLRVIFAACKSRDAKFCVSQGVCAVIVSGLLHECIGMGRTGDARFCVSTGLAPLMEMGNTYAIESL